MKELESDLDETVIDEMSFVFSIKNNQIVIIEMPLCGMVSYLLFICLLVSIFVLLIRTQ